MDKIKNEFLSFLHVKLILTICSYSGKRQLPRATIRLTTTQGTESSMLWSSNFTAKTGIFVFDEDDFSK